MKVFFRFGTRDARRAAEGRPQDKVRATRRGTVRGPGPWPALHGYGRKRTALARTISTVADAPAAARLLDAERESLKRGGERVELR